MADTIPQIDPSTFSGSNSGDTSSTSTVVAPSAEPPVGAGDSSGSTSSSSTGGIGASVWVNGKKINALWAINQNRNSWVSVAGVGWVKFANNSDSAIVAFTVLGANARNTQGTVNYRQESDSMLHEMYVW